MANSPPTDKRSRDILVDDLIATKQPKSPTLVERLENIATGKEARIAHIYKACKEAAEALGSQAFAPSSERAIKGSTHEALISDGAIKEAVDTEPPQPSLYWRSREETLRLAREVLTCSIPSGEGRQGIMWAKRFAHELLKSAPSASWAHLEGGLCKALRRNTQLDDAAIQELIRLAKELQ